MTDDPQPEQRPNPENTGSAADDPSEQATRRRLERAARSAVELIGAEGRRPQDAERGAHAAALDDPRTLAAVLEASPEAIVLFDADARIADWSPAARRLLGFPRDRVVGRDLVELLFPRRLRSAIRAVIETRAVDWGEAAHRSIEIGLLHNSGEEVPAQLSLSWAAGSGLFAAHFRDASEQGERERELASEGRRRTRLLELGQLALADRDLEELTRRALQAGSEEVGLRSFELWRTDEETGELVLARSRGASAPAGTRVRPAPGSRLSRALNSDDATVVTGDPLTSNPWLGPDEYREGTPVGIAAILSGADGLLGVLSGAGEVGGRFSTAETSFFESLAQILASAIERERSDRSLADAETRLRTLVERLPVITYRAGLGPRGRWYYISPQVEEMLGYSADECLSDNAWWDRLVHPGDFARVAREEQRAAREGVELDIEYRMRARDGRVLWIRDRASVGHRADGDAEVVVEGVLSDVSETKRAEARLRYLADHDDLTNLLNRRGFETAVDRWLSSADGDSTAAVALIDLDHLKIVNDSLGHAAGDALLREIADSTRGSLREGDIFGRLSGDEFGLFISGIDQSAAERRVGELVESIRNSSRRGLSITASAGVTMVEGGQTVNATDLLIHADLALYRAKEKGRDRVVFSDGNDDGRLYWVSEVREAIEEGRLALYAQPIVEVGTGAHYSDELLVRMIDRDGRAVPARQFIPTAERFGLIRLVDRWVLDRAVGIAARGGRVAVNISAASIADAGLTDRVGRRLREAGVDPGLLSFEITETVATPTIEILQEFSQRVEKLGCKLSMDDAGTGFGTLTYLRNLNVSQLKIDMSFVGGVLDSETDRGIVRSIVMIAKELGLATVAEGVESPDVLAELLRLEVDYAQGYLLGEPRPLDPPLGLEGA